MTTSEVAEYLGMASGSSARKWIERRGIAAVGRQPGRAGENLYPREVVINATGPGRGYRSDLHS